VGRGREEESSRRRNQERAYYSGILNSRVLLRTKVFEEGGGVQADAKKYMCVREAEKGAEQARRVVSFEETRIWGGKSVAVGRETRAR